MMDHRSLNVRFSFEFDVIGKTEVYLNAPHRIPHQSCKKV